MTIAGNWRQDCYVCAKTKKRCFTIKQCRKEIERIYDEHKLKLYFYKCNFCGDYHLTKMQQKKGTIGANP